MSGKFNKGSYDLINRGLPTDWRLLPNSTMSAWFKATPDTVSGDYHIFGNDKFAVTRNDSKISVVQSVPEKQCMLWSKLEDTTSEIGPNLTVGPNATPSYASAKFGNGMKVTKTAASELGVYWDVDIPANRCCIEFWVKLEYGPTYGTGHLIVGTPTQYPDLRIQYNQTADTFDFNYYPVSGKVAYFQVSAATVGYTSAGDILHVALVFDVPYVSGSLTGLRNIARVFFDGAEVTEFLSDGVSTAPTYAECRSAVMSGIGPAASDVSGVQMLSWVDNLKVWNYAKTDFSDIEIEGASNFIDGDNGIPIPSDSEYHHMGCRINPDQTFSLFLDGENVHDSTMKLPDECFDDLYEKFWPDHWWTFEEKPNFSIPNPPRFYDVGRSGGPSTYGTYYNTPTVGAIGRRGLGVSFVSASSEYGIIQNSTEWDFPGDFTWSIWVYRANYSTVWSGILSTRDASNDYYGGYWGTSDSGDRKPYAEFNLGSIGAPLEVILQSPDALTDGTWYHHAITREGSLFSLYVNGELKDTTTASGVWNNPGQGIHLSHDLRTNQYASDSTMDDFRIYNRALSVRDVRQLYEYTRNNYKEQPRISVGEAYGGRLAKPKCWWPLNERGGTTVYNKGSLRFNLSHSATSPGINKLGVHGGRAYHMSATGPAYIYKDGSVPLIASSSQLTASAWIYWDYENDSTFVFERSDGTYNSKWGVYGRPNDYIYLAGASGTTISALMKRTAGQWIHVVGVWNGTTGWIYLDGQLVVTGTITALSEATTDKINFGKGWADSGYDFDGRMQNIMLFDFAATAGEASQLYNLGRAPDGEVCDVRYDRTALSDDEMRRMYEANRPTDVEQDAGERHIRL